VWQLARTGELGMLDELAAFDGRQHGLAVDVVVVDTILAKKFNLFFSSLGRVQSRTGVMILKIFFCQKNGEKKLATATQITAIY
jgi:hypothetical protein